MASQRVAARKPPFDARIDEITRLLRTFVDTKAGFAEAHAKARILWNTLKQFDLDQTGTVSPAELQKVLTHMNITSTPDERAALFDRFDDRRQGQLPHKEFAEAVFGVIRCPQGDPEVRGVVRRTLEFLRARHGDDGVRALARQFRLLDRNSDKTLTKEELFNGLQRFGVQISVADADVLARNLNRDGTPGVSQRELMRALRGYMPACRADLVWQAFSLLDTDDSGMVTAAELSRKFDVSQHPKVAAGQASADSVMGSFMAAWDDNGDMRVTREEWLDYHLDLSAGIDDDSYFELLMRNVWHISGGNGQAANTSCRRVLVTYKGGRQQIEEIKNDLGVGADKEALRRVLEAQGCRDIIRIDLYN